MSTLIGQSLGPYQIVSVLGHGGMSDVYLANQPSMGREVALKVLPAHLMQDGKFLERFNREVQVIAKLKHPRILPVHDFGEQGGLPYIVMAYMEAGTLGDRIREGGALPLSEAVRLVNQMAEGLDYAHKRGVIHRDFKPSNVLLDTEGNAHLADFGIARLVEDASQLTGSGVVGTPAYMAPEMSRSGGASPLADIYSLGVTLFEMLTGQRPFKGDTPISMMMAHANEPVPDVRSARPDLPVGIQAVLARAMAKDAAARYQSAGALAADLARAAGGLDAGDAATQAVIETPRPTITPPVGAARRRSIPVWGWAVGIALLLGAVAAWRWGDISPAISGLQPTAAATEGVTPGAVAKTVPVLTLVNTLSYHSMTVRRIAFSPDGKTLASASADHSVALWDVQTGQKLRIFKGFTDEVTGVAFSPTEPLVAASSLDGTIILWDTRTGEALHTLTAPAGRPVWGIVFSPDGSTLASLESSEVQIITTFWDVRTGASLQSLTDTIFVAPCNPGSQTCKDFGPVTFGDVALSPVQPVVAVTDEGSNCSSYLNIWDLRTGARRSGIVPCTGPKPSATLVVEGHPIGIAFNPDGSVVAAAVANGSVTLWPTSPGVRQAGAVSDRNAIASKLVQVPGGITGATDLDWSPGGEWLALATPNPLVVLLDPATLDIVLTQEGPKADVYSVTFSPDGKILATGLTDGTIMLWRVTTAP